MNISSVMNDWVVPVPVHNPVPRGSGVRQFNHTSTSDLVAIVQGDIDPVEYAAFELNARCKDHNGLWVGLKGSERIYDAWLKERSA